MKRSDNNQAEIISTLRKVGASVQTLHEVGRGVPDILVGYRHANYLLEVKSSKGKLNARQCEWHQSWNGHVFVVHNSWEALEAIGAVNSPPDYWPS